MSSTEQGSSAVVSTPRRDAPKMDLADEDNYGSEVSYNADLEDILAAAECQVQVSLPEGRLAHNDAVAIALAPPASASGISRGTHTTSGPGEATGLGMTASQQSEELERMDVEEKMELDIEDLTTTLKEMSPFQQFRKKGFLSVSDLIGTVWCEVQYDYRLRTLPFLPPSQRPAVITSKAGASIPVDKVKVEDKDRILKRGEKIHKRLEREIHPDEIVVRAETREDVWGLRFLNMLSALEALITLGKCRELPVVGFVQGTLIMGIIDEIARVPISDTGSGPSTRAKKAEEDKSQTRMTAFFSPSKGKQREEPKQRTHNLLVSDSKTRASGTLPKEEDTLAGRLQVMLYKELLDGMLLAGNSRNEPANAFLPSTADNASGAMSPLPSRGAFSWDAIFAHLHLSPSEPFSESFLVQSRPIITGNGLRHAASSATCLNDMTSCWTAYVESLGLGPPSIPPTAETAQRSGHDQDLQNAGRTENRLELVYRRAGPVKRGKNESKKSRRGTKRRQGEDEIAEPPPKPGAVEDRNLQMAIEASLAPLPAVSVDDVASADGLMLDDSEVPKAKGHENGENGLRDNLNAVTDTQSLDASDFLEPKVVKAGPGVVVDGSDEEQDKEEDELAWAVEMSLGATNPIDEPLSGDIILRTSQPTTNIASSQTTPPASLSAQSVTRNQTMITEEPSDKSGSIIGRSVFTHSPRLLAAHLESVLQWWMGTREAEGVKLGETNRCGWCEFEQECEWRKKKADEMVETARKRREACMA